MRKSNAILMIEDNQDDIDLTIHKFERSKIGNHIIIMRDGESALDFLFFRNEFESRSINDEPVLIIIDLGLPGIPGTKVIEQINSNSRTRRIKKFVLTASRAHQDMIESMRLGIDGYLRKPLEFSELIDKATLVNGFEIVLVPSEEQR